MTNSKFSILRQTTDPLPGNWAWNDGFPTLAAVAAFFIACFTVYCLCELTAKRVRRLFSGTVPHPEQVKILLNRANRDVRRRPRCL